MLDDQKHELPTESIKAAVENILDLIDDCLLEIFSLECFSILDLCSIREAHPRLKQIVDKVFPKRLKSFTVRLQHLSSTVLERRNTRRILRNFGSFITELKIDGNDRYNDYIELNMLLAWVTEHCNALESIELTHMKISIDQVFELKPLFGTLLKIMIRYCNVTSAGKTLLSDCESVVELELKSVKFHDQLDALKNNFPQLTRFAYDLAPGEVRGVSDLFWSDFFRRHQNVKSLKLSGATGISIPMVVNNYKQLEELHFQINVDQTEEMFEKAVSSIVMLDHLKKLKFWSLKPYRNITKLIQGLKDSTSLNFLSLQGIGGDSELISALSKLTRLQVLELLDCRGLTNLYRLADLKQLTKLAIISDSEIDFDIVAVIKRLINLKTVYIHTESFKINKRIYQQIVEVVRGRQGRFQDALEIHCFDVDDVSADSFADGDQRKIVKIVKH